MESDGILVVENLEGQPFFMNPAFCSMLGFSEEETRNKYYVDFSPPEDVSEGLGAFPATKSRFHRSPPIEKRYFRKDGSLVWGRLSISLLNSRPSPLVIAMRRQGYKKRAEEALLR